MASVGKEIFIASPPSPPLPPPTIASIEADIELVMAQCDCTADEARAALEQKEGDLVEAIMSLTLLSDNEPPPPPLVRVRIAWTDTSTGRHGNGDCITREQAEAWVEALNKESPGIVHRVEVVNRFHLK